MIEATPEIIHLRATYDVIRCLMEGMGKSAVTGPGDSVITEAGRYLRYVTHKDEHAEIVRAALGRAISLVAGDIDRLLRELAKAADAKGSPMTKTATPPLPTAAADEKAPANG